MTTKIIDRASAGNARELAEALAQFLAIIKADEGAQGTTTLAEVGFDGMNLRMRLVRETLSDGSAVYDITGLG